MKKIIVQNYNTVLTLSKLYHNINAIIIIKNDHLHKIYQQLLNIKKISFKNINKIIYHKLTTILQPYPLNKYTKNTYSNSINNQFYIY